MVFDEDENDAWAFALNQAPGELALPTNFYRSEWEQVIQAQNITNADQYLKASRIGRGTSWAGMQKADLAGVSGIPGPAQRTGQEGVHRSHSRCRGLIKAREYVPVSRGDRG